ncbi:hypothetical protein BDW02DRAFT_575181 [Decorospora gaudefroyi]|uniref:Uncharacterized protein n=1 Tax=Decorospora gaudefroyi TaxID=184978 RepID=A0A6A5K0V5_9PLEO|nr:hypothetical protein BDW02DRAFT_575181 [Decorospora gaudefroyi]
MQITGFHRWGFVIVRTAPYNDSNDELWTSLLERIRADTENSMTRKPPGRPRDEETPALLLPLVRWDVLEDREHALAGSDVDAARRLFSTWRDTVSVERDGEGADHMFVKLARVARFRYFVMIDQESLESLNEERELAESPDRPRNLPPVKVRVVDAGSSAYALGKFPPPQEVDEEDEEEDENDESTLRPIEGCTEWDVGWMWVSINFLLSFYDTLQADQGWDLFYERPPKIL